jgi:hypothetical protein
MINSNTLTDGAMDSIYPIHAVQWQITYWALSLISFISSPTCNHTIICPIYLKILYSFLCTQPCLFQQHQTQYCLQTCNDKHFLNLGTVNLWTKMHCYVTFTDKYWLQSLFFFWVLACFRYTVDWLRHLTLKYYEMCCRIFVVNEVQKIFIFIKLQNVLLEN